MTSSLTDPIIFATHGQTAIITLNLPHKLNALSQDLYYQLATYLRQIADNPTIYLTILTGKGHYFSAGVDVVATKRQGDPSSADHRREILRSFVANNLDLTKAFYAHPKILITALNGPAIGLSAALIAFSDFVYAAPHTFLLTPFSSLGLVAEGGASVGFVQRLGISKANEALIMSKRISAEELLHGGFVNKIFDAGKDERGQPDDKKFLDMVLEEVKERLGNHLDADSLLRIKALIRKPYGDVLDSQNVAEVLGGLERFVAGIPQEEFRKIASGEKKHKL